MWAVLPIAALAAGGRWRRSAGGARGSSSRQAARGVVSMPPLLRMSVTIDAVGRWLMALPKRWCSALLVGVGWLLPLAGGVALFVGAGGGGLHAMVRTLRSLLARAARDCWHWRRGGACRRHRCDRANVRGQGDGVGRRGRCRHGGGVGGHGRRHRGCPGGGARTGSGGNGGRAWRRRGGDGGDGRPRRGGAGGWRCALRSGRLGGGGGGRCGRWWRFWGMLPA